MEGCSKRDEAHPQLLDLIRGNKEWFVKRDHQSHGSSEEKKLELRLGPPGEEWSINGYQNKTQKLSPSDNQNPFLKFPSMAKELSSSQSQTYIAGPKTAQKRTAPAPAVGWPPIRSFRKNLASSSSSKPAPESPNPALNKALPSVKPVEISQKGLFVKINMDGVHIGRKVDLKAYDSYEKLSVAVDELFRDLLAAQRDSSAELEKPIIGVLDGSGEYTLVYEDNEGDRMLVGDVPWQMFLSTVKRLRVLKSSELSALSLGSKQGKIGLNSA